MEQRPTETNDDSSSPSHPSSLWEDEHAVESLRYTASSNGHLDVLKHTLTKTTLPWNGSKCGVMHGAAKSCHFDIIQWLLKETDHRCKYAEANPCYATLAFCGNVEVLKCLIDNGCQCMYKCNRDLRLIWRAAIVGKLETIMYARRELNCPRDEFDCMMAAANGHLNCFRWMVEDGWPWDRVVCRLVGEDNGHMDIVRWIDEH